MKVAENIFLTQYIQEMQNQVTRTVLLFSLVIITLHLAASQQRQVFKEYIPV